jgi:hypothetical protein
MTNQTEQAVAEASAAALESLSAADDQKERCLAAIADGLPAAVDRLAKRAAQAEPDTARRLGPSGVRDLKNDLSGRSAELAVDIRSAAGRIGWPENGLVAAKDVHGALFKYLYGARLEPTARVLKDHGLLRSEGAVLPQDLYDEKSFGPLAHALSAQSRADAALAQARKADDLRAVDDLWDNA